MDKKTLTSLFSEFLFQVPDYQRGYAWELEHVNAYIQDIAALVEDEVTSHYTGTVVVYCGRNATKRDYGTKRLSVADIVDGQQRLTTSCLYLSVIIRALLSKGEAAYERELTEYLYCGALCKLALNNDTANLFFDLLKSGRPNTTAQLPHEKRLVAAHTQFQQHVDGQLKERGTDGVAYLKELFIAVTQRLHFTFYTIEDECEIGMTFELMNSRGKGLSVLELLKNYLMHWVSRNEVPRGRRTLTAVINKSWKDTYKNLGECDGDEDQCLRVAWTLYCSHSPGNWIGYKGFKQDEYIPLRSFAKRTKGETRAFIIQFADGLAEVSSHYAIITNPTESNTFSVGELRWLTKIHNTGNIANFLALIVAARKQMEAGRIAEPDYVALLKALECFAYRVFLYDGRRSNAGKSSFHRWASEILNQTQSIYDVTSWVHNLTRYYASEDSFTEENAKVGNWYGTRHLLKYTLYEYELHLLDTEGKGKKPLLTWEQLSDSTIEHILPQTPDEHSHWKAVWSADEFTECVHDIGNLVLTQNNSNYRNFDFGRKKGTPGQSPAYCDSDIRQERRIARFADWTRKELIERRNEMTTWINDRWRSEGSGSAPVEEIDEENEDGTAKIDHGVAIV